MVALLLKMMMDHVRCVVFRGGWGGLVVVIENDNVSIAT